MIQIQNLSYKYSGATENVFDGLTLSFDEGKIFGLLGKNGVGKSTLLHLLVPLPVVRTTWSGIVMPCCLSSGTMKTRMYSRGLANSASSVAWWSLVASSWRVR